jgi:type I restriction enzyme M protein
MKLSDIRDTYRWDVTCQGSVPVAVRCFLESEDYESFLRNVLSLKCDTDTLCAIGGGIAEEFYHGTGFNNKELLKRYLDPQLYEFIEDVII